MTRALGLVDDSESGGTHTSRTIMLDKLTALLADVGAEASVEDYERAVLARNTGLGGSV